MDKNNKYGSLVDSRKIWLIGLAVTFICTSLYAFFMSIRTFPTTEGWYSEYAWQINHGKLPYRDFEYLFFPFYIYFIAFFTKIFGYSIIALRILGVIVFGGIASTMYCIFSKLTNTVCGVIGAIVSCLFLQSEGAQVFYDYIRFQDLFAVIAALCIIKTIDNSMSSKEGKEKVSKILFGITVALLFVMSLIGIVKYKISFSKKSLLFFAFAIIGLIGIIIFSINKYRNKIIDRIAFSGISFITGVFVALECMVKQSNGMVMLAYGFALFIFLSIVFRNKGFYRQLMGYTCGVIVSFSVMVIFLLLTNSFDPFIKCCFKSAVMAKGTSIIKLLTAWLPENWKTFWNERIYVIGIIVFYTIAKVYKKNVDNNEQQIEKPRWIISILIGFGFLMCSVFLIKDITTMGASQYSWGFHQPIIFFCSAITFIYYMVWFIKTKKNANIESVSKDKLFMFSVLGVIMAQAWGNGMSSTGLASSQTALGFGVIFAQILYIVFSSKIIQLQITMIIISCYYCIMFMGTKINQTYAWWYTTQGSWYDQTEKIEGVPLLKGIKVKPIDKECIETTYYDIVNNTDIDDEIFVFPNCPIFYTISGRHSKTYTKVQWFDVSSESAINKDINYLRKNNPKEIVFMTIPESVYESHEKMFGDFQTRKMRDFLKNELISTGKYIELHTVDLQNGCAITTYLLNENQ